VNVAFVLDRSGSMGGEKIELVKEAARRALQGLSECDRFSIVVYDDQIDVLVASTPASSEAKRNALERLRGIDARNTTNLADGWLRGAEQVALHQSPDFVNRCLLLTDGLANVGITAPVELERHAAELRRRGVATSTFGVGADFDEALLQAMAQAGGGHFYFIERPQQIPDLIASELGEILETVARDAAIEVRAAEGVLVEPLSALVREGHGNNVRILLGDLVSGQELDVVLHLSFPEGEIVRQVAATCALTDRENALDGPPASVTWEYADHAANDAQPRDREVDRQVAALYGARAKQQAVLLNRKGDYEGAAQVVYRVAERIRTYAGQDAELNGMANELNGDSCSFAREMPPLALKQHHFASSALAAMRMPTGQARRKRS
jgi:Ca-activated chloride channel family protein